MCKDTIDSDRVQIQEQLFNEQVFENRQLATENIDLRKRIAELEEQIDAERRRSTAIYTKHQDFIEWTRQLFRNKTIPESSKLVLWQYHLNISSMRDDPINAEMRVSVEDTADAIGVSTSTVRKATDKADMFDVLKRRYEQLEINGEKRTVMHIALNPIVSTPQKIQMEKHHGGKRVPSCPSCGGTDVDRYTVQFCRHCKTNTWYGQPGLRSDSDVMQAQKAQDANMQERLKKQDAFEPYTSIVPIDEFYEESQSGEVPNEEPTATIRIEDAIPDKTSKKQDAFEPYASSNVFLKNQNQLATELNIPITAASCNFTEHRPMCRLCGPISHWGWSPSEQKRICPRCYTPQEETKE